MESGRYLDSTFFIDCDSEAIKEKAQELIEGVGDPIERAKRLFYFARDGIKYNVYAPKDSAEDFRASATLVRGEGYCVQKAVLFVALARAGGIPARLGFAMIRNNLLPLKLFEIMKTTILPWHGYARLFLNKRWVKATPAFDKGMCEEHRIIPVEFDGVSNASFHSHNKDGQLHIEYLKDRGSFDDVPLDQIQEALRERGLIS